MLSGPLHQASHFHLLPSAYPKVCTPGADVAQSTSLSGYFLSGTHSCSWLLVWRWEKRHHKCLLLVKLSFSTCQSPMVQNHRSKFIFTWRAVRQREWFKRQNVKSGQTGAFRSFFSVVYSLASWKLPVPSLQILVNLGMARQGKGRQQRLLKTEQFQRCWQTCQRPTLSPKCILPAKPCP